MNPQPRNTQRKCWLLAIPLAALIVVGTGVIVMNFRSGIRVTVVNAGPDHLRSLVLYVTGRSYPLGDLAPGDSAYAFVDPTSESHLEIEFVDANGNPKRLNAGGYFESGYRGTIRITIKDDAIVENIQDVRLG